MANIRITNRQRQVLNLLVKTGKGKVGTKSLLPKQSIDIPASQLTQMVFDLNRRGHLSFTQVVVPKDEKKVFVPKEAKKPVTVKTAKDLRF